VGVGLHKELSSFLAQMAFLDAKIKRAEAEVGSQRVDLSELKEAQPGATMSQMLRLNGKRRASVRLERLRAQRAALSVVRFRPGCPGVVMPAHLLSLLRALQKLTNFVKNFQCHAVREILGFADVIVFPHLWTKDMISKEGKLAGSTKQLCKMMAFYRLSERLYHAQQLVPLSAVIFSCEPGTSITCPVCGTVNKRFLGGNKFLFCNPARGGCGYDGPRDGGSACSNFVAGALRVQGPPGRSASLLFPPSPLLSLPRRLPPQPDYLLFVRR